MEVSHDPSVLPDQFNCFAVAVEYESSPFEDGSDRRERRSLFVACDAVHMPQRCGLCW